jgi:hypothetical protein
MFYVLCPFVTYLLTPARILVYSYGIGFEILRKTVKDLNQGSKSPGQHLNRWPVEQDKKNGYL